MKTKANKNVNESHTVLLINILDLRTYEYLCLYTYSSCQMHAVKYRNHHRSIYVEKGRSGHTTERTTETNELKIERKYILCFLTLIVRFE